MAHFIQLCPFSLSSSSALFTCCSATLDNCHRVCLPNGSSISSRHFSALPSSNRALVISLLPGADYRAEEEKERKTLVQTKRQCLLLFATSTTTTTSAIWDDDDDWWLVAEREIAAEGGLCVVIAQHFCSPFPFHFHLTLLPALILGHVSPVYTKHC